MAKNKAFKRRYIIEFRGITTNSFVINMIDKLLRDTVRGISHFYKQTKVVGLNAIDMHKKLEMVKKCDSCGASMWDPDAECLLCKFEERENGKKA